MDKHVKSYYNVCDYSCGLFHYDFDARWYDPVFPQFTTVDPLSGKYPHISPFTYCAANPVMYIDPTGMREWKINPRGYIVGYSNRHPNKDIFVAVDKNGKPTYDKNGAKVIVFKGGTITDTEHIDMISQGSMDSFMVKGDHNAQKLFEFFATPTQGETVEWSWLAIEDEKSQDNIVGTSHKKGSTGVGAHYSKNHKVRKKVHNHPDDSGPSEVDKELAKEAIENNPNTKINDLKIPVKVIIVVEQNDNTRVEERERRTLL